MAHKSTTRYDIIVAIVCGRIVNVCIFHFEKKKIPGEGTVSKQDNSDLFEIKQNKQFKKCVFWAPPLSLEDATST
jgi:hypothetical protein